MLAALSTAQQGTNSLLISTYLGNGRTPIILVNLHSPHLSSYCPTLLIRGHQLSIYYTISPTRLSLCAALSHGHLEVERLEGCIYGKYFKCDSSSQSPSFDYTWIWNILIPLRYRLWLHMVLFFSSQHKLVFMFIKNSERLKFIWGKWSPLPLGQPEYFWCVYILSICDHIWGHLAFRSAPRFVCNLAKWTFDLLIHSKWECHSTAVQSAAQLWICDVM